MVLEILRKRRSIRKFQASLVEPEKIEALQEVALRSPSSRFLRPWEFVFVTDPELLGRLSKAREHGTTFIQGAPLAVVVAADPAKCDVWVEDCSISAVLLQAAAESLGLGSCWAQIRLRPHGGGGTAEAYVRELLGLPESYVVECVIAIGYPGEAKPGRPKASLPYEKIHANRFRGN
ncbi:MAG: nitroreductase family protein [Deltaproteobacteria bacterium]|nr:nitroreductase family protein [Deltaproteobacteria bacterium]